MKAEWIEHNNPERIANIIWFECKECGYGYPTKLPECPHCKRLALIKENNK